jgi:hypothetical protein
MLFSKNTLQRTHCKKLYKDMHRDKGSIGSEGKHLKQMLNSLLRKEVIQPQVPLRLPCYDFTPITPHTFGACLLNRGWPSDFWYTQLSWCDGRCVQGPGTYSPERADLRLLAIPASGWRVAANHPNWDAILGIGNHLRGSNPLSAPL